MEAIRDNLHLSMKAIVDQLEGGDIAYVMDLPLSELLGKTSRRGTKPPLLPGMRTDGTPYEEPVAKKTRREQPASNKKSKAPKAKAAKAKAPKKAPPHTPAANGKATIPKVTDFATAAEMVDKMITAMPKGTQFKMGDLIKASAGKISRLTLVNAVAKLGDRVDRQGAGRGTYYVVA